MKYLIFGDVHGRSLEPLEKILDSEKDMGIICLGDFDTTKTVHQAMNMLQKYGGVIVAGNHDEMIYDQYVNFNAGAFIEGSKMNAFTCIEDFNNDQVARDYLRHLLYGTPTQDFERKTFLNSIFRKAPDKRKKEEFTMVEKIRARIKLMTIKYGEYSVRRSQENAAVVHAGFAGELSDKGDYKGEEHDILWYRLYDTNGVVFEEHAQKNFDKMKDYGVNILIRGHDHIQSYLYRREDGSIDCGVDLIHGFRLFPRRMHIINPGAYYSGDYAVIDTKSDDKSRVPILKFYKL